LAAGALSASSFREAPLPYEVIKRYGHEEGLSVAFRQWRAAHSHCHLLHGYAVAFEFTFACKTLDDKNWCYDFGNLKELKEWLKRHFDHKTLVAEDDPQQHWFSEAHKLGIIDALFVPQISCEKFAEMAFEYADDLLKSSSSHPRVWLVSVKASEHSGNTAIYSR
jgi:6-pyruvoyltetrahydropterin/6-carboxytetrahydropterin synthase